MKTRSVLSVDAFAEEPLGGLGVPVVPDGSSMTDDQLRAVAGEFGARAVVAGRDDGLDHVARLGYGSPVAAAVAGAVGLASRDALEPGTHVVSGPGGDRQVELGPDRTVTVGVEQSVEPVDRADDAVAAALGVPVPAVADIDLPVGRADGAGGSLLVPVTFLEHIGSMTPDGGSLATLLDGHARVVAYTFDTLAADVDVHARVFGAGGGERATSGVGVAGCAQFLGAQAAYDGAASFVRVASGRFCDRPARLDAELDTGRVSGRALVSLDGTVTVPETGDDDIVAA